MTVSIDQWCAATGLFHRTIETYLYSTISSDNNNLNVFGYNLIRADQSSNTKRGGVCIYYKESLAVQTLNSIGLPECLVYKVCLGNKLGHHLQTRPGPGPRPSKNQTLILWTPEKLDPSCDK